MDGWMDGGGSVYVSRLDEVGESGNNKSAGRMYWGWGGQRTEELASTALS